MRALLYATGPSGPLPDHPKNQHLKIMTESLNGKKIAILAADGFEQVELEKPLKALREGGAEVEIVSPSSGTILGMNHENKGDRFEVDRTLDDSSAQDYDGLLIPGGLINPDTLRSNEQAVRFTREFFEAGKPVAAICHGPWVLIEAGVVEGRKLTSWPAIQTDVKNAGGHWIDEEVVCDRGLVTSRNPDDIPAFIDKMIEEFCEGKHRSQARATAEADRAETNRKHAMASE